MCISPKCLSNPFSYALTIEVTEEHTRDFSLHWIGETSFSSNSTLMSFPAIVSAICNHTSTFLLKRHLRKELHP